MDEHIIELYQWAMQRYRGDVIFIVTSDHGEFLSHELPLGFGKQWRKRKTTVHDMGIHIPFIIFPSNLVTKAL